MVEGGRPKGNTSRRTPCGPAAPAGLPLWPESVVREEKVEIGRGGGHRIGNKGEFWWDYAGL